MSCSDSILHDNNIRDTVVLNLHRTVGLPQDHELQVCNDYIASASASLAVHDSCIKCDTEGVQYVYKLQTCAPHTVYMIENCGGLK